MQRFFGLFFHTCVLCVYPEEDVPSNELIYEQVLCFSLKAETVKEIQIFFFVFFPVMCFLLSCGFFTISYLLIVTDFFLFFWFFPNKNDVIAKCTLLAASGSDTEQPNKKCECQSRVWHNK